MAAATKTSTKTARKTTAKASKATAPTARQRGASTRAAAAKARPSMKKAAAPSVAKVDDPRRSAFTRLAEGRASKAISQIRLLGNLSNLSAYDYSRADVEHIVSALQEEITIMTARFNTSLENATLKKERSTFRLGGFDARI